MLLKRRPENAQDLGSHYYGSITPNEQKSPSINISPSMPPSTIWQNELG